MSAILQPGHRAAVIGATGTIGSAICAAYAEAGAVVSALDLYGDLARETVSRLPGEGHTAGQIDVTVTENVTAAANVVWGEGAVDSIAYAAGIETTCDVVDTVWETHRRVMQVNLDGAIAVGQAFGRRMLADNVGGSFVYLASTAGKRGEAGGASYCASKFALLGFVESFAAEAGPAGIRVNALCPGNVDSPMLRSVAAGIARREGRTVEEVLRESADAAAERRLVDPAEVAAAAVWLASPVAGGINGESVNVDAGALTG